MSTSEILSKKLDGLLFGLKQGTKKVSDVLPTLNHLKATGQLIFEDYQKKYITIIKARNLTIIT